MERRQVTVVSREVSRHPHRPRVEPGAAPVVATFNRDLVLGCERQDVFVVSQFKCSS
jgi:hypothetical protein